MSSLVYCKEVKGGADKDKAEYLINPSSNNQEQSSQESSSSSSSNDGSTTKVYNTYVTNEIKDDGDGTGEETNDDGRKSWITGGVIGSLLNGKQITFIIAILCGTFIIFIIVRNRRVIIKKK